MRGLGRRSTVLGVVALAVLSAVLLTATAAQAFTKGEFRINNETFTAAKLPSAEATALLPLGLLNIPGLGIKIHCETAHVTGTLNQGGGASASGLFLNCFVVGAACTVYDKFNEATEKFEGEGMITASGTGEVGLAEVQKKVQHFAKAASSEFSTVYFAGEKCTLSEENLINGSAAARLTTALEERVEQQIADISKEEEEELGVALKFGAEPAFIEVAEEAKVTLTEPNKGKTFGAQ